MGRLKAKITVLTVILLLGITGPITSYGWEPKLAQVVYITLARPAVVPWNVARPGTSSWAISLPAGEKNS